MGGRRGPESPTFLEVDPATETEETSGPRRVAGTPATSAQSDNAGRPTLAGRRLAERPGPRYSGVAAETPTAGA